MASTLSFLKNKNVWSQVTIIIIFLLLSMIYFYPEFAGKQLRQSDMTNARGMINELVQWEKNHPNDEPMWTNSMFGGMPAYLIKMGKTYNIYRYIRQVLTLGLPAGSVAILFLLMVGFYFLMQVIGTNRWLSAAAAIGYAFASYNIIIIAVGHITKAYSLAFMPAVVAGILLLYQRKYLYGGWAVLLTTGLLVSQSHPQIAYYTFLVILIFFLVYLFNAIREKELKHYITVGVIAIVAAVLSILPVAANLLTTAEYSKYSMRGPSELTSKNADAKKSTGLDHDYAFQWSYGTAETFSILIPNFVGAGVNGFDERSKTAEQLRNVGIPAEVARQLPVYWGKLPFTVGPAYFGAIICFLFVLGLFVVKGPIKWWLAIAAALSIMLSWGKNFSVLSDLFFYYFPGYNKFRTVDMILVIANFAFPLLGFWALKEIIEKKIAQQEILKSLKYTAYIVGGLLLIFLLVPGWFFDFTSLSDAQLTEQLKAARWPNDAIENLLAAMREDRMQILRADTFRSLIYIGLAASLLWWYVKKSFRIEYFAIPLALLILVDMWSVDRRYLNKDYFVPKSEPEFVKSHADEVILSDVDPHYRVLNLTRSVFNDGYTSYFHKSIGGYHGAKLRRYQDMIDGALSANIIFIQQYLSAQKRMPDSSVYQQIPILNMLNCKYIIYNPEADPLVNTGRLGNAWFVKSVRWVDSPDAEYAAVNAPDFNPAVEAIVDKRWEKSLPGIEKCEFDTTATIQLTQYKPHALTYQVKAQKPQIAVFSEIFYEKGWNAYLDGQKVPHGRANYILRTMVIPAGEHTVEFKFEPATYYLGQKIAMIGSVIVVLLTLSTGIAYFRQMKRA
ncbi:MAG TPA: YfhO family protein [Bacteroidales bacterium]|nr:YfhO family protein [Bacteroidales bacterium]HPO65836.1 YfhO family protein [Bacteroidales bacterium]